MRRFVRIMTLAMLAALPARAGDAECVGACHNPLQVNITDLLRGVSIALGETSLGECPAFDADADARVTVDELLTGVRNALDGCGEHFSANQCTSAPPIGTAVDSPGVLVSTSAASREAADPILGCGCAESPRTVWATYTAPADGRLQVLATSQPRGQAVAVLTGECGATSVVACATLSFEQVVLEVAATAGTRYLVEVTSGCDGGGGAVRLNADLCGDGITTSAEECDDGNVADDDGCDRRCTFEGLGVIDTQSLICRGGGSLNLRLAPIGQLFVPAVTNLGGVDLMLSIQRENQPQSVTVILRRGGLNGEAVAEQTITTSPLPGTAFYHFDFGASVAVVPGETYALEVTAAGDNVSWIRKRQDGEDCPVVYPGGGAIGAGERLNNEDFVFRTYAAQ